LDAIIVDEREAVDRGFVRERLGLARGLRASRRGAERERNAEGGEEALLRKHHGNLSTTWMGWRFIATSALRSAIGDTAEG
jgi:hypothetical protein